MRSVSFGEASKVFSSVYLKSEVEVSCAAFPLPLTQKMAIGSFCVYQGACRKAFHSLLPETRSRYVIQHSNIGYRSSIINYYLYWLNGNQYCYAGLAVKSAGTLSSIEMPVFCEARHNQRSYSKKSPYRFCWYRISPFHQ